MGKSNHFLLKKRFIIILTLTALALSLFVLKAVAGRINVPLISSSTPPQSLPYPEEAKLNEKYLQFSEEQCWQLPEDTFKLDYDVFYLDSPRSDCLSTLAAKQDTVELCQKVTADKVSCITTTAALNGQSHYCDAILQGKNLDWKNDPFTYMDYTDCVSAALVTEKNISRCKNLVETVDSTVDCMSEIAENELATTSHLTKALGLAKRDLTRAIKTCELFSTDRNKRLCYLKVSNELSGIEKYSDADKWYVEPTNTPMYELCADPNREEFIACLYGSVFDAITRYEAWSKPFEKAMDKDSQKQTLFCESLIYHNGQPARPGREEGLGFPGKKNEWKSKYCREYTNVKLL